MKVNGRSELPTVVVSGVFVSDWADPQFAVTSTVDGLLIDRRYIWVCGFDPAHLSPEIFSMKKNGT